MRSGTEFKLWLWYEQTVQVYRSPAVIHTIIAGVDTMPSAPFFVKKNFETRHPEM